MLYTEKEKHEIERVKEVFAEHLRQSPDFELLWSDKVGYVWLAIGVNPVYVDTGIRIESAADLCGRAMEEVATDVIYMTGTDQGQEAAEQLRNLYQAQVKQYGVDRVQILSPFRSTGAASVDQLFEAFRELVNPQSEDADLKVGSLYIRVGDKVMQNKNSIKASNGDIGFIRSFRHDERDGMRISIQFSPTRVVEYSMVEMGHEELAYAPTVHKAQGSEFDVVLFPLLRSHARMLTRSLVYTAITRAKSKVILVGQIGMLYMAVHKDDTGKRNTQLGHRISLYTNTFKVQQRSA